MTPPRRSPTDPSSADGVFEERLNGLETATREGFKRMEALLQALDDRLRAIETATVTRIAVMETRLDAAWKKIDDHEVKFKTVDEDLKSLPTAKDIEGLKSFKDDQVKINEKMLSIRSVLLWGGSAIGMLIVYLLWAIFTHQVEIVQVAK